MTWEDAFLKQYDDACTGRLVRGIVHNLNGVNQAFSLQATLFKSMFSQAEKLISSIESGIDVETSLKQLKELLQKRSLMAEQMEEKVLVSHNIVKRIQPLFEMYKAGGVEGIAISAIVDTETEFLCADSFFKHKVKKHYNLPSDLPIVVNEAYNLHSLIYILFANAIDALQQTAYPQIWLNAHCQAEHLVLEVSDNGCGVDPLVADTIFDSFVTTKKDHLGVGLYILFEQISASGGTIAWLKNSDETVFRVTLPLADL